MISNLIIDRPIDLLWNHSTVLVVNPIADPGMKEAMETPPLNDRDV